MSDRRYAPPSANLGDAAPAVAGTGQFDLGEAFNEAWAATWANFGLLLAVDGVHDAVAPAVEDAMDPRAHH